MGTIIKPADKCNSLAELRFEIDRIDQTLIQLMSERLGYVKAVVKYRETGKKNEFDHTRYLKVLDERAKWAGEAGLNGEEIKKVFKLMIDYYIEEQKQIANK
jgi:isochorismate pyruvate lyase